MPQGDRNLTEDEILRRLRDFRFPEGLDPPPLPPFGESPVSTGSSPGPSSAGLGSLFQSTDQPDVRAVDIDSSRTSGELAQDAATSDPNDASAGEQREQQSTGNRDVRGTSATPIQTNAPQGQGPQTQEGGNDEVIRLLTEILTAVEELPAAFGVEG